MNQNEAIGIRAEIVMARNVETDFAKKTALTVLANTLDTMLDEPDNEAMQAQWEQNRKRYEEQHGPLAPIIGYLPQSASDR